MVRNKGAGAAAEFFMSGRPPTPQTQIATGVPTAPDPQRMDYEPTACPGGCGCAKTFTHETHCCTGCARGQDHTNNCERRVPGSGKGRLWELMPTQ